MKGLQSGIPLVLLAATAHAQHKGIGGSGASDVGNSASIPTVNTVSSSVNGEYTDDHSWDIDHKVHINPQPYGHWKRVGGDHDATGIDGSKGVDIGNSASIPTYNGFSSEVNGHYKDDHSVDIDTTTEINPPRPHYWSGHYRRSGDKTTLIGGAKGDDIGNIADIPTVNSFSSELNQDYQDNHSVDFDADTTIGGHHRRRGDGIGGAKGVDVGNSASIPTVNSVSSTVDETYTDDHSFDLDSKFTFKPHWGRSVRPDHGDTTVIGGNNGVDIGNIADIPTANNFDSETNEAFDDNHSVNVDTDTDISPHGPSYPHHGQPHYEGHGTEQPPQAPQPQFHSEAQPPAPAEPDQSECTKVQQVVHTVTSTRTTVETQTVYAQDAKSPEPSHQDTGAGTPTNTEKEETPANHEYASEESSDPKADSESTGSWSNPVYQDEDSSNQSPSYPKADSESTGSWSNPVYQGEDSSNQSPSYPKADPESTGSWSNPVYQGEDSSNQSPSYPKADPESTGSWSNPVYQGEDNSNQSPSYPNELHGGLESSAPVATPLYHASEDSPQPTPTNAYHGPATPDITHAEASSFAMIPVFVPSGTPRAHGSVVIASSSTPIASSASYRAAVPTGASPEENHRASASPSSHGAVIFTGSAGQVTTPFAGVFTVLAGVFAVLAFAL